MSRRDLLIGLQHATQQGIKMREGSEMSKKSLVEQNPNQSPSLQHVEPTRKMGNQRAFPSNFDQNSMLLRKIDRRDPAAEAEQARREQSEKKMRELSAPGSAMRREPVMPSALTNEEYRMKAISDAISGLLESGARTRYITKAGKSGAFHRGVRGTGAVEERGHKLGAMSKQERDEMEGRKKFGELKREAKRNPR